MQYEVKDSEGNIALVNVPDGVELSREEIKAKGLAAIEAQLEQEAPEPSILDRASEWLDKSFAGDVNRALGDPVGDYIGLAKTGRAIVTGMAGNAAGGIAGLASLPFTGVDGAVENMNSVRDFVTIGENDPQVQENMRAIGDSIIGRAGQAYDNATSAGADATFEATGSPGLATMAKVGPDAALEVLGLGAAMRAPRMAATAARAGINAGNRGVETLATAARGQTQTEALLDQLVADRASKALSVGSQGLDPVQQRAAAVADLPYPLEGDSGLTVGQLTRNPEQVTLEGQLALKEAGRGLNERTMNQTEVLTDNIMYPNQRLNDLTAPPTGRDSAQTGAAVKDALTRSRDEAKLRIDEAYKAAAKSPDAKYVTDTTPLAELFRTDSMKNFRTSPQTRGAYRSIVQYLNDKGFLDGADLNKLTDMPLEDLVTFRQDLGDFLDVAKPQQYRMKTMLTKSIDDAIDSAPSELYRRAQDLRRRFGTNFERNETVAKLLKDKKGTDRDLLADTDVVRIIADLPLAEMKKVQRRLVTSGPSGKELWNDIRTNIFEQQIVNRAFNLNKVDSRGNPTLNIDQLGKSIQRLTPEGKLEWLFGRDAAKALRNTTEAARIAMQKPPGTINPAGTANAMSNYLSYIADLADIGSTGGMGAMFRGLKNARTQARVKEEVRQMLDGTQTIEQRKGLMSGFED